MDPNALSAADFNFIELFLRATIVVKGVMIFLAGASLWSWAVIIDKTLRFRALAKEADRFEQEVSSGRSLEEVAQESGDSSHALPRMLQGALGEWRQARAKGALGETQVAMLMQRIDRILDTTISRESSRVEDGLSLLAIVATASPFVGLFGTVWGIMHAFQAIAIEKNTSLAVVAPSIAEALFATAIGLAAAIPAYIAYNKFSADAGHYSARLEAFADDLATAIQRRLAERV
ncbi:MAG: protein TolQ [Caulobacteraceae bacterium]|nr:protein TolQ [Caulobacteraceae bacterium]